MTQIKTIEEVAEELGEVYFINKDSKRELDSLRGDFFVLATTMASLEGALAQKTVAVPSTITDLDDAEAYVTLYHTGWRIVDSTDAPYKFVLEEDPNLLAFTQAVQMDGGVVDYDGNEHPGYVVVRTIVSGSATLDDDRLKAEDIDLYNEVTEYRDWERLKSWGVTLSQLKKADWPRVLKSPDDLTPDQQAQISPYVYESARSARLNVRYAKEKDF